MKKLFTLVSAAFIGLALTGPATVAAQPGDPCDGLDLTVMWGCEDGQGWASVDEIVGATNPVSILWSTGATNQYLPTLESGSYWVTVTDGNDCSVTEQFNIYCDLDPDCSMDADLNWGCLSPTSGWASVENITGATGTISYLWSTGHTTQYVSDLPDGDHWVMVLSDEDCWVKKTFSINCYISPDCTLGASVEWGCLDTTNAWASVDISGATGTVTILWSNGENTQFVTGFGNGDHWVMVSEAEDCWVKTSFTVACEMDPDCPLSATVDHGCDDGLGWATVADLVGDNADTEIHWSTGENTMSISGLTAGAYYVVILNSETCWMKHHFAIECGVDPDCDLDADVEWGCLSSTSGWASVENITGATGSISIQWSTGATSQYVSGLSDGDHWVMVTDSEGCWVKKDFTVGCWVSPDCMLAAVVDVGCLDTIAAWASVDIYNATGTVSILWSHGATTQFVNDLTNGDHWVMVSEADDCWVKTFFTVDCEMDPDCALEIAMDHGCVGDGPGYAAIEQILGGSGSTEVHWSTGDTTMSVTGLVSGDYFVVVMNSETCWLKQHFEIDCGPELIGNDPEVNVLAFPVPANNILNLEIEAVKSGLMTFLITDHLGRVMLSQGGEAFQAGEQRTVPFSVDALENGSYMLTILRNGEMVATERVIIQR